MYARYFGFSSMVMLVLLFWAGCEPKGGPTIAPPPPMNQLEDSDSSSVAQYSYKHKALMTSAGRRAMQGIYVVAVARVGDTGLVEGSPFGNKVPIAASAEVDVKIKADADKNANITVMSQRDQKLRPEPTPSGFSLTARSQIISDMQMKRCFTVVERQSINDILREIGFGQSDWVDSNSAAPKGRLQGVHYIVKGGLEINAQAFRPNPVTPDNWVGHVGFPENGNTNRPFIFRLRMYHVETGAVVAVGDGYGDTTNEAISNAVNALTTLCMRDYRENHK